MKRRDNFSENGAPTFFARAAKLRIFKKGLRPPLLLTLTVCLFCRPVWAEDISSPPTSKQPANSPESNGAPQVLPAQISPVDTEKPGSAAPTTEAGSPAAAPISPAITSTDPDQGGIFSDAPGRYFSWLTAPLFEPCCPGAGLDEFPNPSGLSLGFGWWDVERRGNPFVIGQWQDTHSSPFWDVDGLQTNGARTFNYSATGTDNESTRAKLQYYGPNSQGSIDFNRFPHAQEHENFNNMKASALIPGTGPGSGQPVIAQDLNVGQNYAIRVDQFESKYKFNLAGRPGKDDSWVTGSINIWDQREFGDRQANNTVHCFTAQAGQQKSCHVLSQKQGIDWNTFEVTPTLEARYGRLNIQYSHNLRVFSTHDDVLIGQFTDGGANIISGNFPFASVPQSTFNMDKIKLGIEVNDYNKVYAYGYVGFVEDTDRHVGRDMGGFDLRWTNTAFKGLNLTTYVKNYDQSGERPPTLLPDETQGLTPARTQASIRTPVGFNDYKFGEKFNWRPWTGCYDSILGRLSFTGGYEFDHLIRVNERWSNPLDPPNAIPTIPILFQPNTNTHTLNVGVQTPWSDTLHSYVRYKIQFIENGLVGYRQTDGAVNSSLPDLRNIIEFGGDWFPSPCFGASVNETINLASRRGGPNPVGGPTTGATVVGDIIDFREDSYATSLVTWWTPMDKLTLTANAAYFTNHVNQNISVGDDYFLPGDPLPLFTPVIGRWNYAGTAVVLGCGINYRLSRNLRLTADYEIADGKNEITNSDGFSTLAQFSAVRNVTQQVRAGVDWKPRERLTTYFRYQLVDFQDRSDSTNNGALNMFLAGMRLTW
jgi:hypothetical protein